LNQVVKENAFQISNHLKMLKMVKLVSWYKLDEMKVPSDKSSSERFLKRMNWRI
jgi:hypothetical protein